MIWDLNPKSSYLIAGCGASVEKANQYLKEHPEMGLITVNRAISGFDHIDMAVFMHYEPIILSLVDLPKADLFFLPDPCPVGRTNTFINWDSLYPYPVSKHPNARIFKRVGTPQEVAADNDALFNYNNVATCALSLLVKMGLKEVYTAGVGGEGDGGTYNYGVCNYPEILREDNSRVTYQDSGLDFQAACEAFGIEWHKI
jgi:hypothetical protein